MKSTKKTKTIKKENSKKKVKTKKQNKTKAIPVSDILHEKILIINVDRDDDIGKLLSVSGPIIGYENNLKLANELILKDPEESDANCIFGSLKKYNDLKNEYNVEIATLTGHSKENIFYSDKKISEQIVQVLKEFPASGVVFITDGAEDDQVTPIIQNYLPIISKETIIVKQAKHIESIFYTIKKALRDPFFARIVFGVPALIFLLFFIFKGLAFQILALVLGIYFLIKGFNLEEKFSYLLKDISKKFSIYRISFPFYLTFLFFIVYAVIVGSNLYLNNLTFSLLYRIIYIFRAILLYLVLGFCLYFIGEIVDLFYDKEVYNLGKKIFAIIAIIILLTLVDVSLQFVLEEIIFTNFIFIFIISILVLLLVNKITSVFNITTKVTELLIGLPVVSKYGTWLGVVENIDKKENIIIFRARHSKSLQTLSKQHFQVVDGKIII